MPTKTVTLCAEIQRFVNQKSKWTMETKDEKKLRYKYRSLLNYASRITSTGSGSEETWVSYDLDPRTPGFCHLYECCRVDHQIRWNFSSFLDRETAEFLVLILNSTRTQRLRPENMAVNQMRHTTSKGRATIICAPSLFYSISSLTVLVLNNCILGIKLNRFMIILILFISYVKITPNYKF